MKMISSPSTDVLPPLPKPPNTLHLFSININSLSKPKASELMASISHFLHSTPNPQDPTKPPPYPSQTIIAVQETHWTQDTSNRPSMRPFLTESNQRSTKGGGTALILSPDLLYAPRPDLSQNTPIQATTIELPALDTLVVSYYNSLETPALIHFIQTVEEQALSENKHVIFLGDANCHHKEQWGSSKTTSDGNKLAQCLIDTNLNIYNNGDHTRYNPCSDGTPSDAIDVLFGSIPFLQMTTADFDLSDHTLLYLPWHLPFPGNNHPLSSLPPRCDNFSTEEWDLLTKACQDKTVQAHDLLNESDDIDLCAQTIHDIISSSILEIARRRPRRKEHKHNHWYLPSIGKLIRNKKKLYRKIRKTTCPKTALSLRSKARELTKEIKKEIRRAKRNAWQFLCKRISKTTSYRDMWKLVNRSLDKPPRSNIPTLLDKNKSVQEIANHLNLSFSKLGEPAQGRPRANTPPPQIPPPSDEDQLQRIIPEEVQWAIQKTPKAKAPGIDGITNDALKHLPKLLIGHVTRLFNLSLERGHFPALWKRGIIQPIPKRTQSRTTKDYRPITLLPSLGKILERLVTQHITEWVARSNAIADSQFGFTKRTSTTHAILNLTNSIEDHIGRSTKNGTLAILLDLKAAYDSVNHHILVTTLLKSAIPSYLARWLQNYLADRSSQTRITLPDGQVIMSSPTIFDRGVPQGSPLSPILFNIMINGMVGEVDHFNTINHLSKHKANFQLYADDAILWINTDSKPFAQQVLQDALTRLSLFLDNIELSLNPSKCQSTAFYHTKSRLHNWFRHNFTIYGTPIPIEKHPKYLGLWLDRHLDWRFHATNAIREFGRRIRLLRRLGSVKSGIRTSQLRTILQSFVLPALEYAAPIWMTQVLVHNPGLSKRIYRLDRLAKLVVLGLNPSSPYKVVDIESAIPSPILRTIALSNSFAISNWDHRRLTWLSLSNSTHPDALVNRITKCAILSNVLPADKFPHFQDLPPSPLPPPTDWKARKEANRKQTISDWQEDWNDDPHIHFHSLAPIVSRKTKSHYKQGLTRHQEVLLTRARSNHAHTNHHKHRLHFKGFEDPSSAKCRLCSSTTETVDHLFVRCPAVHQAVPNLRTEAAKHANKAPDELTLPDYIGDVALLLFKPEWPPRKQKKIGPVPPPITAIVNQAIRFINQTIHF
jgi:hypothetical protein